RRQGQPVGGGGPERTTAKRADPSTSLSSVGTDIERSRFESRSRGPPAATPSWTGEAPRRPDGAQRLVLPADAPLRHQRPQSESPPQLRPRHGGETLTYS